MKNTLKTFTLLAAIGGLLLFIGQAFGGSSGLTIALVISLVMVGGSYWFSDKIALRAARAQEVSEQQLPEYHAIMRELCQRADMPMPRLYISPEQQPNAFATGRNPDNAAVCITRGILDVLTWQELRGVLAHEISHVRNRDILIGSVAAAIAMAITFAARMAMWAAIFGGGRGDGDRNPLGELALIFLAPVAAMVLQMALSRSREYQADTTGARLIGDGEPLAKALEKLHAGAKAIPSHVPAEQAQAYIVNPLSGRQMSFRSLFTTHPPMEDRIRRLRAGEWRS